MLSDIYRDEFVCVGHPSSLVVIVVTICIILPLDSKEVESLISK